MALLQFQTAFTIFTFFTEFKCSESQLLYPKTRSWKDDTDCCLWDGVTCDFVTGHVIGLDLSCSLLNGTIHLNSSLYRLQHLRTLNLAYNSFLESRISPNIGHLRDLKHLNLSMSGFVGKVPLEIAQLSHLVLLDLSSPLMVDAGVYSSMNFSILQSLEYMVFQILFVTYERIEMPNFDIIVKNLTSLRILHLDSVKIESVVPHAVANLSTLTSLRLNFCNLGGKFPSSIFRLPRLETLEINFNQDLFIDASELNLSSSIKVLDFTRTNLTGSLPVTFGRRPPSLRKFLAVTCNLYGTIPTWIWNTTEEVSLDENHFTGNLPSIVNKNQLSSLTSLTLSSNLLSGTIPSWLFTLPSLEILDLSDNQLFGEISGSVITGNFSLEEIHLGMNKLSIQLAIFSKFKRLTSLDLSSTNLSLIDGVDSKSSWPKLRALNLSSCNISEFPHLLRSQHKLGILDLSQNNIKDRVPRWFADVGKDSLLILNISHNYLTGGLELSNWKELYILDLRSNLLQGSLPSPPSNVGVFLASNNKFSGEIPSSFCNFLALGFLDLSNNILNGTIPRCLGNLGSNKLQGPIPMKVGEKCALTVVDLSDNLWEGPIPRYLEKCTALDVLDMGENGFNDTFPHWLHTLPNLKVLILRSNNFHGSIVYQSKAKHPFLKLQIFDLSGNYFTGELTCFIGQLVALWGLNLSHNHLHGPIPSSLANLTSLEVLDLSTNKLEGGIPPQLGKLTSLAFFNVSENQLSGPIPHPGQLGIFSSDSYEGNLGLCGFPLPWCGERVAPVGSFTPVSHQGEGFLDFVDQLSMWEIVMMGCWIGMILGFVGGCYMLSTGKPAWFSRKVVRFEYALMQRLKKHSNRRRRRH